MRARRYQGWLLLEAMFAVASVAFMLSLFQSHQATLDHQLHELKQAYIEARQRDLKESIEKVFAVKISTEQTGASIPSCQSCQGAVLKQVLEYELNQW